MIKDKLYEIFSYTEKHKRIIEKNNIKEGQVWSIEGYERDSKFEISYIDDNGILRIEDENGNVSKLAPENLDELIEDVKKN